MNLDLEISKVENELRQMEQTKAEQTSRLIELQKLEADVHKKLNDIQRETSILRSAVKKIDDTIYRTKRTLTQLRQNQRSN